MIYLTCTTFFAMFSYNKSPTTRFIVLVFIIAVGASVTLYYHYLKDPLFHQNAFAILTATVIFKLIYEMEHLLRPSRKPKDTSCSKDEQVRLDKRDIRILKTMWALCAAGVGSVGIGFLIWNLDNIYCSKLRLWRRELGLPWGILLEGHGWWYASAVSSVVILGFGGLTVCTRHLFTSLAAYYNLVWMIWLRWALKGKQDEAVLVWPSLFSSLPEVVLKENLTSSSRNARAKRE
jgi:dihydroceramidase